MRNICFGRKESVLGEKLEGEVKEGKDTDNFVSFLYREGNKQNNEPEVQKGFSIQDLVKLNKLQTLA